MTDEHSPNTLTVVEVALALIWRDGQLLISRRRRDSHLGGHWEFPGGKLLSGESPEAAAVREALEEVGVHCSPLAIRPVIEWEYPEQTVRLYPVDCTYESGEPQALEVAEVAWVPPSRLGEYQFPPANAELIAAVQRPASCEWPRRP